MDDVDCAREARPTVTGPDGGHHQVVVAVVVHVPRGEVASEVVTLRVAPHRGGGVADAVGAVHWAFHDVGGTAVPVVGGAGCDDVLGAVPGQVRDHDVVA